MWRSALFVLLLSTSVVAQTVDSDRFDFATKKLPDAVVGKTYSASIKVQGGRGPFEWTILRGKLPQGIRLQSRTGTLAGTPALTGTYRFTVKVRDLGARTSMGREFVLVVSGPLLLEWVDPPKLTENAISGRIKVSNGSAGGENFDLTVIIVAVNEIGKAFALGYQRFNLAEDVEQEIPFSSTLPNGQYVVHVDAIAEVAATRAIYRSRLQTQTPLVVNVNR